ncbi:hypothetical protein D3C76_1272590 [compost metagenome]
MQAGAGVQHHVASRQLHALGAVGVLDFQFAAVVVLGLAEEQRGGKVGAHPFDTALGLAHGVVDVEVETAAGRVTVQQRRKHLVRQCRRHELRILPQPLQHGRADFLGQRMTFRQLQVVLGLGRLIAGGDLAIGPIGLLQSLANALHFFFFEQAGNVQQHGAST